MNYNTQFSVSVAEQLTQVEVAWIEEKLAQRVAYDENSLEDEVLNDYWLQLGGTAIAVEPEGLLIYSEADGSVDAAADFIQEFLAAQRPTAVVVLEWANTASRMTPGAFGGGVMVISATEIVWPPIQQWVTEAVARLTQNAQQPAWHAWPLRESWEHLSSYLPKGQAVRIRHLLKRSYELAKSYPGYYCLPENYTLGQLVAELQLPWKQSPLRELRSLGLKSFALLQAAIAAFAKDYVQQIPLAKSN
ncbi:MAG: hypothetical protein NT169_08890 [Chloroflexi bacterium]|nr:hypothetical protein [Chloroflexota bacterium]